MFNDALTIARDLIRCPSVTPADAGALGVLETRLKAAGFEVHRITFSEPGAADIDNLYARIGGGAPHLAFAGHTDVVPGRRGGVEPRRLRRRGEGRRALWPRRGGHEGRDRLRGRRHARLSRGEWRRAERLDLVPDHRDEEDVAVNGTVKLLQWAAARGEKFDHCVLGEPSNVDALGDTIKAGRRGSQSGTLIVDGVQGHVAYPHRAANPIPDLAALIAALSGEPLDRGTAHFQPSNLEFTSVDVGNTAWNVIPGQARARFNIRYNDAHTASRCAR